MLIRRIINSNYGSPYSETVAIVLNSETVSIIHFVRRKPVYPKKIELFQGLSVNKSSYSENVNTVLKAKLFL